MKISEYPTVFNLGHKAIEHLFDSEVLVEEKVDGSQFSFGVFDGELLFRSKGQELFEAAPEKMFKIGIEAVVSARNQLTPGYVYRGEYLSKPKHNAIAYDRTPNKNIAIFDIERGIGTQDFLSIGEKRDEVERIEFEIVPLLYMGMVTKELLERLLTRDSFLGGSKIEGIVIKPLLYNLFGRDKKVLLGKYVSEAFKETNKSEFSKANPKGKDIIGRLIEKYRNEARWLKSVQHLRDAGKLEDSPRDIGPLIAEIQVDLLKEEEEAIRETLFNWAKAGILRGSVAGFVQWYKARLFDLQFDRGAEEAEVKEEGGRNNV